MKLEEAYETLGLKVGARSGEVEASWRRLRSERHPDRPGGDVGMFTTTKRAYQIAIAHASKPQPCPDCDGLGWDHVQRGWSVMKKTCQTCKGSGKINAEE